MARIKVSREADWIARYVGLPYQSKGREYPNFDCYGLARHIYREQLGIELPSFDDSYKDAENRAEVAEALSAGLKDWLQLDCGIEGWQEFDLIILKLASQPFHCGLYLGRGKMIHTMPGQMCIIERVDGVRWTNRIEGAYRCQTS